MKKKEIIKQLDKSAEGCLSGNCYLDCDNDYYNLIILKRNNNIVLAAHDDDFAIDGYLIFSLDKVKSFSVKTDIYNRIMMQEMISTDIFVPDIDCEDMHSVCESIFMKDKFISLYRSDGSFYIGKLLRVKKHSIIFRGYDADGVWLEPVKISFDDIGVIRYGDRYTEIFSKYVL